MSKVKINTSEQFKDALANYPEKVQNKMLDLRQLILETATEIEKVTVLHESLKWGEPSFNTPFGSTLRMDWKAKNSDVYALYFQCTSRLVPTFKHVFGSTFNYEKNRAIIFKMDEALPKPQLKACIKATLLYHKVKHLPSLGIMD